MDSVQEHFKFRYKIVKIGKKSQQIPSLAVVNEKLCTTCTKDIYFFHFVPLFQTSSDGNCPKDSKKKKIKLG